MFDPLVRQRVRRGLHKGEVSHALTLIMACIIYWQAREINRMILEVEPEAAAVDLSLLEHISPIG